MIKKGLLLSIGLAALAKDKVEQELKKHLKDTHLSKKKVMELSKKMAKKAMSEGGRIEKSIRQQVMKEINKAKPKVKKKMTQVKKRASQSKVVKKVKKVVKRVKKKI